eukprot:1027384-Pyramimonas_sp.AAC.1
MAGAWTPPPRQLQCLRTTCLDDGNLSEATGRNAMLLLRTFTTKSELPLFKLTVLSDQFCAA